MAYLLLALGLVLVVEGLVFALASSRIDEMLEALKELPPETRRIVGLVALALGVALIWLARSMGV